MENQRKEPALRCFIYLRKSTESEDRQVLSLDAQLNECRKLAQKNNVEVVEVFKESKSAKMPGRPEFSKMMDRIKSGEVNSVTCWKLDRLSRNPEDAGKIIGMITRDNIKVVSSDGIYDNSNSSVIMQYMNFAQAHCYIIDLSNNVKRGNKEKFFNRGEWIGVAPPGYINKSDYQSGRNFIDIDEKRFPLLQKAGRMIISGKYSSKETWKILNNDWKYRTIRRRKIGGTPLSYSRFRRFLTNPFYYGLMVRKEGKAKGKHQTMFTKEEWDLLQKRIGNFHSHYTKHEFPYKQVLKCGSCDGSITAQEKTQIICPTCKHKFHKAKKRTSCPKCKLKFDNMKGQTVLEYVYYNCTSKSCTQGSIRKSELEKTRKDELEQLEIDEDWKNYAIKYLNELNDEEAKDHKAILNNLLAEKKRNDDALKRLQKEYLSPHNENYLILSPEEYKTQKQGLLDHQNRIDQQMDGLDLRQEQWMELSAKTFDFASQAKYWFENGSVKEKTHILATLGKNLVIKDKKLLIDQYKPFFLIKKAKEEIKAELEKLEPGKEIDMSIKNIAQSNLNSTLRKRWDSNP